MKNYIFHLLTLMAMLVGSMPMAAQSQDNALYVYRNDGDFNAFLREDLDSIVLSRYDTDSVYQKECITQVFYTPDSVYRIPIAAIDSVSFVPLPTIVNSMVFPFRENARNNVKYLNDSKLLGFSYFFKNSSIFV